MKKLLNNKKGFTLIEMLIVVAIIVILVAISIPTFTANLENSRRATDDANLRAAKSAAITEHTVNGTDIDGLIYDIETGKFVDSVDEAYGKATGNTTNVIKATITTNTNGDEEVTVKWASLSGGGAS